MKAAIFFLCLLVPALSSAATDTTFKGLDRLDVAIEKLDQAGEQTGLTQESLQSLVTVAIKRDIPTMRVEKGLGAYIYVVVTCKQTTASATACFVSVELTRPVKILKNDFNTEVGGTLGVVWDKGMLLHHPTTSMASKIREEIEQEITDFAAEYYRQNP